MDNPLASEIAQDTALLDSIFRFPESFEPRNEFLSFDEHISSYTTDVEPIFNRDLFESNQPL
ncbi:Zinc finger C2H2 [Penicillium viridicatum]|nr:Zinc finger C2H2 [Penicillium viridicatum]